MSRVLIIILSILAVACGLLVGVLNAEPARLDLLWFSLQWPLGLLVLLAFAVGLLLGMAVLWLLRVMPLQWQLRRARTAVPPAHDGDTLPTVDDKP